MANKELQPAHLLWKLYKAKRARYRFSAKNPAAARRWQKQTRAALSKLLALPELPAGSFSPKLLEQTDKGDYIRQKWMLRTSAYSVMPVYLLLPKAAPRPMPVVLAFHGHGYGVGSIIGIREDGSDREMPEGLHADFGIALCRRGFAVAAPEISCFGQRQTDFSRLQTGLHPSTCAHTAALASHLGTSALALRIHDGIRLVDYLQTRRELDVSRLGAMGISGGGMHAFFSAAVDLRIKALVVSGYFCQFRYSIFSRAHCPCNYVHGLGQFGEIHDLAGLIAPRPMLVESGAADTIFPREGVVKAVAEAVKAYRVFGAEQNLQTDYFEGGHQISGRLAYDFLWRHLRGTV